MNPQGTRLRLAEISASALAHNFGVAGQDSVDLSGDAFGHGVAAVVAVAREAGIREFTVGTERERVALRELGVEAQVRSVDETKVIDTYGLRANAQNDLQPVMSLTAQVVAVKSIEAGGGVSYGYTWKAPSDGWLALVALGYGDGFNRAWGNRISALVDGAKYPAVGRVAMDAHSISTGAVQLEVGQSITYLGQSQELIQSAGTLADAVGCSPLAVTANLGRRVLRQVIS